MPAWIGMPALLLLAAVQVALIPALAPGQPHAELLVVWIICWSALRGRGEAMPWAIAGGLLLDLLSQGRPGVHLLALAAVAFLADLAHHLLQGSAAINAAVSVFVGSLLFGGLILFLSGRSGDLPGALMLVVVPTAVLNLVTLIPVLLLQRGIDRRFSSSVLPAW